MTYLHQAQSQSVFLKGLSLCTNNWRRSHLFFAQSDEVVTSTLKVGFDCLFG